MTLRKKTMLIFGAALAALFLALFLISSLTLLDGFSNLEEQETAADVQRTLTVLLDDQYVFSGIARNWASRDDTYAFAANRNQDYLDSNLLLDSSWDNNRLNLMAFIDTSGTVIYSKAFDLIKGAPAPVTPGMQRIVIDNPVLRLNASGPDALTGFMMLPEGPMLVSSQSILTGRGEGPARGTLIWGRYLNAEEIARISRITSLTVDFFPYASASLPADVSSSVSGISPESLILVRTVGADTIAGYTVLDDIYKAPAMILRIASPRTIYQRGQATMGYTLLLLLSGVIFCVISLYLIERTVLSRVSGISRRVEKIAESSDPSVRLEVGGKDEISRLGSGINKMLAALENSRQDLLKTGSEEQSRREELSTLFDLSRSLADVGPEIDTVLDLVTRHAVDKIHVTYAQVNLLDGDELVIRTLHPRRELKHVTIGQRLHRASQPFTMHVMRQSEPLTITPQSDFLTKAEQSVLFHGVASMVCVVPLRIGDRALGVIIFGEQRSEQREPFSEEKIRLSRSVGEQTASALRQAELFEQLEGSYLQTVLALANAVEAKDTYTLDHAQQLAIHALAIGQIMGLSKPQLEDLRFGAILHDIGKIGMPDSILQKSGRLTDEEWSLMRQHTVIGERILSPVPRLRGAARIVRSHHERYDGAGYPDGLAGAWIPLGARILATVDSYGAMRDKRVYKDALSREAAMAEIKRCNGTQFDPAVVEIFIRLVENGMISAAV